MNIAGSSSARISHIGLQEPVPKLEGVQAVFQPSRFQITRHPRSKTFCSQFVNSNDVLVASLDISKDDHSNKKKFSISHEPHNGQNTILSDKSNRFKITRIPSRSNIEAPTSSSMNEIHVFKSLKLDVIKSRFKVKTASIPNVEQVLQDPKKTDNILVNLFGNEQDEETKRKRKEENEQSKYDPLIDIF